jgi:hypothetical protein
MTSLCPLNRRTVRLIVISAVIMLCANAIPLRIPFVGEQEADGYMLKTGWPCAFWEQTRHRTYVEWRDVAIDAVVALMILAVVGRSSEWTIRKRSNYYYARYLTILIGVAIVVALNLHEHSTAQQTVRGWPMAAIINGDFGELGIHHNRIDASGAAIDAVVGVGGIVAFVALLKLSGMEARLARWLV